jgi:hypothetical protein
MSVRSLCDNVTAYGMQNRGSGITAVPHLRLFSTVWPTKLLYIIHADCCFLAGKMVGAWRWSPIPVHFPNTIHNTETETNLPLMFSFILSSDFEFWFQEPSRYSDWLRAGRPGAAGVRVPVGSKTFSLLHIVQTGSGVHPTSYTMGTGGKATGGWSWPLTSN